MSHQDHNAHLESTWRLIADALGPVAALLEDPRCNEVMANADGSVWVEMHGEDPRRTEFVLDARTREDVIGFVASAYGKSVHAGNPSLAEVLPVVGARFQGNVPPSVSSSVFTIRLPSVRRIMLEEYVSSGVLDHAQALLIMDAVRKRQNILVVGSTGSGKTTLTNAVLEKIGQTGHRVLTIEDTKELREPSPNCLQLYVNPRFDYGFGHALMDALRHRPDRIVVGELRDGHAALGLLKAWNTGHSGGLATLHADSAAGALPRLELLLTEVVKSMPRELVAQAIDQIVFIERYSAVGGFNARRVRNVACLSSELSGEGDYGLTHLFHSSMGG